MKTRTAVLTATAMVAFAANSLLTRQALGAGGIDPASFTTIRVMSGAVVLGALAALRSRRPAPASFDVRAAAMLFAYMALFSFAYVSLGAGAGALILFAAVQLTMFAAAMRAGERFGWRAWAGLATAMAGLVYLVSPGLTAPDPWGALMMTGAGIAWGLYSLLGRGAAGPLGATTVNFVLSVPAVLVLSLLFMAHVRITGPGMALAMISGAVTSAGGYVIWYAALPHMPASRAATVQLSVPVIAALGAVVLLGEALTWRLVIASALTLSGVAMVLEQRTGRKR